MDKGYIATMIAVLLLIGVVGHFDYEDAKLSEQNYCQNVHDGIWPDYNSIYDEVCHGDNKPKDH